MTRRDKEQLAQETHDIATYTESLVPFLGLMGLPAPFVHEIPPENQEPNQESRTELTLRPRGQDIFPQTIRL